MTRYVASRAGQALIALFAISVVVFVMLRLTGDPMEMLAPADATPEQVADLRAFYGLDRPLVAQYLSFVGHMVTGDLGTSLLFQRPVTSLVAERAGATFQLLCVAFGMSVVFGVPLGVYAAVRRGTRRERLVGIALSVGQAMPPFYLGVLLVLLFGVILRWLPVSGADGAEGLVLPTVTLGLLAMTSIARLTRSAMLEVLQSDYVTYANARGLAPRRIVWTHAGRNAALPVLTFAGVLIAQLIGGSVIVEVVFSWPGLGTLLINSVLQRDYPVVQAVVLLLAVIFLATGVVLDALYGVLNPKLRIR
jgi:peptide/nickel transport system permease protein